MGLPGERKRRPGYRRARSAEGLAAEGLSDREVLILPEPIEAQIDLHRPAARYCARRRTGCTPAFARGGRRPAGRSTDPNLQNIPIRTEPVAGIRAAFVAEPGNELLVGRLQPDRAAHPCPHRRRSRAEPAFARGRTSTAATARRSSACRRSDMNPEQRRAAKTINFGIIYGMSPSGSQRLGIALLRRRRISAYLERFPGVRASWRRRRECREGGLRGTRWPGAPVPGSDEAAAARRSARRSTPVSRARPRT